MNSGKADIHDIEKYSKRILFEYLEKKEFIKYSESNQKEFKMVIGRESAYAILHKFITNDDGLYVVDNQDNQVASQVNTQTNSNNNLIDKATIVNSFSTKLIQSIDLGDPNIIK